MEIKKDILWRVYLGFIGIVVLGVFVIGRAAYIQQVQGKYWLGKSDSLHTRMMPLQAERGTIYSADGSMLSTSIPYFDIYIDFRADGLIEKNGRRFHKYIDSLSRALSLYFRDQSQADYKKQLTQGYKKKLRYYPLKKNLSFEQYKTLRNFPLVNQGPNHSGFKAEIKSRRLNPYGLLANRTIGLSREYINDQGKLVNQNVGLEKTYDSLLKGESGRRLVRFISGGAYIPIEGSEIEPENGKDIITTIDVNTQDIAENALLRMMIENDAEHGTCMVMEVATGKLKAIANLGRGKDGNYSEDYNYAIQSNEPGSTMKLATLLAVLSEKKITVDDYVQVGSIGTEYVGVRTVTDAERAPKPVMTVRECFAHSSNVAFSKLAYQTFASQPDKYISYLRQFHLDKKTGIDLIGEERPLMPKIRKNNEGLHAMVTMSFGYAIEVSPLQTLMLYNAIANNGKMVKPSLVSRIQSNGIVQKEFETEVITEELAEPAVIAAAQSCMKAVVIDGSATKVFKGSPYAVAGKTGTAHVAGKGIKYTDGVYQASFVGYFPADKPIYSCIVVIRTKAHPAFHFGGAVAAPVFKEVSDKLYALRAAETHQSQTVSIKKDSVAFYYAGQTKELKSILSEIQMTFLDSNKQTDWSSIYSSDFKAVVSKKNVSEKSMPDVKGMSLKDALYLLESMNLKVSAKGRGRVASQSIEPGLSLSKNQTITIELN
ncbi:MAG: transpeptidase family protein [Gemmatimonadaceae bacterium]|nr:transpeptidase family protein [Chitinophagaceae bacterium]